MSDAIKALLRQQLAKFVPDPRTLRALEQALQVLEEISPNVFVEIGNAAASAQSSANQALGDIASVAQSALVQIGATDDKATTALQQVANLAQIASVNATASENKAVLALDLVSKLQKEFATNGMTAESRANQALGQIAALTQEAAICCSIATNKAIQALQQIAALEQVAAINAVIADNHAKQALQSLEVFKQSSDVNAIATEAKANQALESLNNIQQLTAVNNSATEAKANQALESINNIQQLASINNAAIEAKANQALSLLKEISQSLQLLALAPPVKPAKRARYGQFYDTTVQTAAAINTAYAITFNTTDISYGVYLGSPTSRVYIDTESLYNFQFSIELDKTSGGTGAFYVWPRINGVDVADSCSQFHVQGNNAEVFVAANFFFRLKAGDYVEIMWAVTDTSVQLQYFAASAFAPAIPSIILTVSNNVEGAP